MVLDGRAEGDHIHGRAAGIVARHPGQALGCTGGQAADPVPRNPEFQHRETLGGVAGIGVILALGPLVVVVPAAPGEPAQVHGVHALGAVVPVQVEFVLHGDGVGEVHQAFPGVLAGLGGEAAGGQVQAEAVGHTPVGGVPGFQGQVQVLGVGGGIQGPQAGPLGRLHGGGIQQGPVFLRRDHAVDHDVHDGAAEGFQHQGLHGHHLVLHLDVGEGIGPIAGGRGHHAVGAGLQAGEGIFAREGIGGGGGHLGPGGVIGVHRRLGIGRHRIVGEHHAAGDAARRALGAVNPVIAVVFVELKGPVAGLGDEGVNVVAGAALVGQGVALQGAVVVVRGAVGQVPGLVRHELEHDGLAGQVNGFHPGPVGHQGHFGVFQVVNGPAVEIAQKLHGLEPGEVHLARRRGHPSSRGPRRQEFGAACQGEGQGHQKDPTIHRAASLRGWENRNR